MIARQLKAAIDHDKPALPGLFMAVLLLSLPNLLLTFWPRFDERQAEAFFMGIGLIALPCVFSFTVRGMLYLWLPAAAFLPAVVIYWLVTGSPLREWALVVLMETNLTELERFGFDALAGIVLAVPAVWFYGWFIRRHVPAGHRLSWPGRLVVLLLAVIIPIRHLALSGWEFSAWITQRKLSSIFPPGLPLSAWSAWNIRHQFEDRSRITQNLEVRQIAAATKEIHVLVIGESARFSSFQINGNPRETTPLLARTAGLLSFENVSAPATVTLMSVPVLLTPSTAESLGLAPSRPSVVSVFRRAGFHTAWFSTQRKHGMFDTASSIFSRDADEAVFLSGSFAPGGGTYESALDGALLEPLRELLRRDLPRVFVVLHTMGSHQHYSDRYPPEFNHFTCPVIHPAGNLKAGEFSAEERRILPDAYDNTIRYTDWVLSQVIETLAATQAVATVYYISDHGQNKGDAPVLPFAHGSMTRDVVQVPLLIWLSPAYREQRPAQTAALESHLQTPLSGDGTFHTLLEMAGLDCAPLDRKRSAASAEFLPGKRLVRSLEGAVVDYDAVAQPAGR